MRKVLFVLIKIIIFSAPLFAQEKQEQEKEYSKAEIALNKSGILVERNFIKIGLISDLLVQSVKAKNLTNKQPFDYLLFEFSTFIGNTSIKKNISASIDKEEINDLINSIKYMQTNVFNKKNSDTEVKYITYSGLSVGCFMDKGKWRGYIKLKRFDDDSYKSFTTEEFAVLLEFIETAKKAME